jgi:hypothetical protein
MYGYDFKIRNSGGLGAILHDVMNAVAYTTHNNLTLRLVEEGYSIPRLNGSIPDIDVPEKVWHSYFTTLDITKKSECIEIWPQYLPNTTCPNWPIDKYATTLQNICTFHPEVEGEINALISKTPFNPATDIVLHIRRTEKILETNKLLPVETYIRECEIALTKFKDQTNRIYICTDDQTVCHSIQQYFSTRVAVVWDNTESLEPLHEIRWNCKLDVRRAQQETMNAFKNLFIMKRAKHLIGGRNSYFFRIGELLRFPLESTNIQDSDMFGIAPYSSLKQMVRPYYKESYPDFISLKPHIDTYKKIYEQEKIVSVPNFINQDLLLSIRPDLDTFKWWNYAIKSSNNDPEYFSNIQDPIIPSKKAAAQYSLHLKNFAYSFKRTIGRHYDTCYCVECKLCNTVKSFPVTDMLSKIVGCRALTANEIFVSNYSKDDFLSMHHDISKGDIAVTFSLSYDWDPTYGGILHFVDAEKNIYKSLSPKLGSINIFRITPGTGIDHFVSSVNVNANRYSISAWYNCLE